MKVEYLKQKGLNLFASIKVSKLPPDILEAFKKENIPITSDQTLCLIGHGGKELWRHLPHPLIKNLHPIDQFAIDHMNHLTNDIQILFPHPQWAIPLQKIGRFLNVGRESLLKIDINQDFGLWFSYRGVFLTKENIPETQYDDFLSPCDNCKDRPCLGLPFEEARLICPFKSEHQYTPEQIQYHAFKS